MDSNGNNLPPSRSKEHKIEHQIEHLNIIEIVMGGLTLPGHFSYKELDRRDSVVKEEYLRAEYNELILGVTVILVTSLCW